jgi:heme A synthase
MVTYSPSEWLWAKDKFWEHGHRLFAALVGMITTLMLVVAYRATPAEQRPGKALAGLIAIVFGTIATAIIGLNAMPSGFMEAFMILLAVLTVTFVIRALGMTGSRRIVWLCMAAFTAVCLQGTFGGYTVRNNLPDWTSTTHGVLAQLFLMIVLGITLLTSSSWNARRSSAEITRSVASVVVLTWGLTFVQFVLGALTRHTLSWGVSNSFPHWSDAGFFPSSEMWQYPQVIIHFVHRTLAYIVAVLIVAQYVKLRRHGAPSDAMRTALASMALVVVQILLGAGILWTARGELVTTLHVMVGVSILLMNASTMFSVLRQPLSQTSAEAIGGLAHQGGGR